MVKCFSVFWIFFAVLRRFGFPKLYTILADCSHVREERDGEGNDGEVFQHSYTTTRRICF